MSHNMNPFDFVPFASKPLLKSDKEWLESGPLQTGYLELQIEALTPLHIVGEQKADETVPTLPRELAERKKNYKIQYSRFYKRHEKAFIPAASIRGLLRAFIEVACNGWASQMTPFYPQEKTKHRMGFSVIDASEELEKENATNKVDRELPLALPEDYVPHHPSAQGKIDLASFLFGYIPKEKKKEGWHGRILIEDAPIAAENLSGVTGPHRMPDVEDSAFMGGPHPSASSWWYQKPYMIQVRPMPNFNIIDFIGAVYRGRKFYYHQDPAACVDWYLDAAHWKPRDGHPIYTFPVECLEAGKSTDKFRLYFEDLPEALLNLLLLTLQPGNRLHHKLGYGKAYGFGSITFSLANAFIREKGKAGASAFDVKAKQDSIQQALWQKDKLGQLGLGALLHFPSLDKLAQVLWHEPPLTQKFTYPPFEGGGGFTPIVREQDIRAVLNADLAEELFEEKKLKLNEDKNEARGIAEKLARQGRRPALHFEVYQRNSDDYATIEKRLLQNAR